MRHGVFTIALLLVAATSAEAVEPVDRSLVDVREQMDRLKIRVGISTGYELLPALRDEANALESVAAMKAADLAPQLTNVQARLAELGKAPEGGDESAEVAGQRDELLRLRARLEAQLRLSRLLMIEGRQVEDQIVALRRTRFEARLGERSSSPLSGRFWDELARSWPQDRSNVQALGRSVLAAIAAVAGIVWVFTLAGSIATLALVPRALRALQTIVATRVPHGRLRRSLLALGWVVVPSLAALAVTRAMRFALSSGGGDTPAVDSLVNGIGGAAAFGTYVAALGQALLAAARPSWRLPPMPDAVATGLRREPFLLGIVIACGWILERLAVLVDTGIASAEAINCLFSLALGTLLAHNVSRAERLRRKLLASSRRDEIPPRPLWLLIVVSVCWGVLVVSGICLVAGYVALGSLLVKQVAWILVLGSSTYLAAVCIDDLCETSIASVRTSRADDAAAPAPALRRQAAVLVSAVCRLAVVSAALALVLGPLGQEPAELLQRVETLRDGIQVGEIRILPLSLLQALLIVVLGWGIVRFLKYWFSETFLPTTSLDVGMRSSTTTLLGYVGLVFVGAFALSALGLGLERIAWVASALSVGIGFGLQAVVQNFVSGLILLTERPVKVGDWVVLGAVEGDVRRINVRATEIQMSDRSTVIVPNSEFITKVVRNVTLANPLGLVSIKLPIPLDGDAFATREVIMSALVDNAMLAAVPPPAVDLHGIADGAMIFVITASVSTPREVSGIRSALLFDIFARLRAAGVTLSGPSIGTEPVKDAEV